jgi:hypothetical protein
MRIHDATRLAAALLGLALALGLLPPPARAHRDRDDRRDDRCEVRHAQRRVHGRVDAAVHFLSQGRHGRPHRGAHIAGETRDLRVTVEWKHLDDSHHQRLELYAPDGSLYQRFVTAFAAGGRATSVETIVAVAGTSITGAGLYGGWCVEVFLDEDDTPVVARPFELSEPR